MTFTTVFFTDVYVWAKATSTSARKFRWALGVIFAVFLISLPALSQSSQGTIQGAIFDQSGGAIPNATVTVTDLARGVSRALTTDSVGEYIATNLTPGTYTVRGEAKGFQTTEHSGVLVEVGKNLRVDLTLQPGQQSQTITVTGEVPAVDTTDSTLGGTLSNAAILALPLNGRNFIHLVDLRPGVYIMVGGSVPGGASMSTNGGRFGADLMTVEGLPAFTNTGGAMTLDVQYRVGDTQSLLPIDAIQEFNTMQNPKAEYGWRPGSVVNVGVRSGTNAIHGSAYAFGRDASATDSSNFFSTPGQPGVTPATVEQFGATAGGPILKDKLFWFIGYEGLRTTLTNPIVNTIPADVPMGDSTFSMVDACNSLKTAGTPISPLSAQLAGLNVSNCTVSPGSPTFENLFPFTTNTNTTGNFAPGLISTGPLNNGLIKVDYVLSQHHHLNGFFYISKSFQITNYNNGQLEQQWTGNVPTTVEMYTGSWTWTPNSTWVNDVRAGYDYMFARTASGDANLFTQGAYPAGYGFNSGVTAAQNPLFGGLPQIVISSFTGYLGAGGQSGFRGPDGQASFIDNVSYLHGKHSFKFGFQFMDNVYDNNALHHASGEVKFRTLADFLTGNVHNGTLLVGNPYEYVRAHWFSGFFQDDYRITPRVTLNLGLRWEYAGNPVERFNYEATFNPNLAQPVQQVGGKGMPSMYNPYYKSFSPRLGVAWDVRGNGKTVVRASGMVLGAPELVGQYVGVSPFGANFPDVGINTSGTQLNIHTPETLSIPGSSIIWDATTLEPNATQSVFPVGQPITVQTPNGTIVSNLTGTTCLSPNDTLISGVQPPACSTQGVNPKFVQPYVVAWNMDVQRAITNNLTVSIAYVGTHGANQTDWLDINQPPIGAGWDAGAVSACLASALDAVPYDVCLANPAGEVGSGALCTACPYGTKYPFLTNISQFQNSDFSNYNSLQMTVNERTTHGLAFLASYTFSHSLDIASSSGGGPQIDANNVRLNYASSDFDMRHHFTFSPTYAIPGIKSPGQMLQGWEVSGVLVLSSGLPWSPNDATNDILGTNEFNNPNFSAMQTWNFSGPRSAFTLSANPFPCYNNIDNGNSPMSGCAPYSTTPALTTPQATQAWSSCVSAATAPYAGNAQLQGLALASLNNIGCYVTTGGGILTPPAYGTIGNASRNIFRLPHYFNADFSVSKEWKFKERYSAQFRAEFFNIFNWTNFGPPPTLDPGAGVGGQFGCSCATPDVAGSNPVLGSGGPRHVQFGLKLNW
jgi:hypothetical protein